MASSMVNNYALETISPNKLFSLLFSLAMLVHHNNEVTNGLTIQHRHLPIMHLVKRNEITAKNCYMKILTAASFTIAIT